MILQPEDTKTVDERDFMSFDTNLSTTLMDFSIATINQMDQVAFIDLLGPIFEETPAVAEQVWPERPFESMEELHKKMVAK